MIIAKYKNKKFHITIPYSKRMYVQQFSAKWEAKYRCWSLPFCIDNYRNMIEIDAKMSDAVHDYFKEKLSGINKINDSSDGYVYKRKPREHQKRLHMLSVSIKKAMYLCGVGIGKTKPGIDSVSDLHRQGIVNRALIVCPANIMENWEIEIENDSYYDCTVLSGKLDKRIALQKENTLFHIINYEMIAKMFLNSKNEPNKRFNYDMIVFDECHFLKNRTSQRSRNAYRISKNVKYKTGLTGTLISNHPSDAFMPYKVIDPDIFGESWSSFKEKFLIMVKQKQEDKDYDIEFCVGYKNKKEFQEKLALNSLRYDIDDVADLPPKIEIIKTFELSSSLRSVYEKIKEEWIIAYEEEKKITSNVLERLLRLSQCTSGFLPKIENFQSVKGEYVDISDEKLNVLDQILDEISEDKKVIIWCRFTHSIDRVAALCRSKKYSYYIYDGRQKDKGLYKKYQNDDTKVWISQIQTGIGYSIPAAKYAIFYELDRSHNHWDQAGGRNRRLEGSEEGSCIYFYIEAKNTVDTITHKCIIQKDMTADEAYCQIKGASK